MRPGGDKRSGSYTRRRRRVWLLQEFDPDLGPDKVRCHLFGLADHCLQYLAVARRSTR